ncbi:hypothetical protein [Anaerosporobacter faecicola]|uniref:hypothetical protein n=1 Tax=Anaerosporobacter faecicola TaxID=2718714 RepID=UPI00143B265B|nr:hypothetical protein [Anaerosporobacter faecicola]
MILVDNKVGCFFAIGVAFLYLHNDSVKYQFNENKNKNGINVYTIVIKNVKNFNE